MSTPYYVTAYHNANRRHSEGCQDDLWEEWLEELGKIRAAWKWSVTGMLTQLGMDDPEIWHALGDAFQNGRGIERDAEQAEQWFRKSAEAGHLSAMIRLGVFDLAAFEFHHGATQGITAEQIGLGVVVVVIVLVHRGNAGVAPERTGVDGLDRAREFRVELGIGDVELDLGDLDIVLYHFTAMETHRGDGPRGVRSLELLAPGLD